MSGAARVGAFALVLAVVFGAALGLGRMVGPEDPGPASHGETSHGSTRAYALELARDAFDPGTRRVAFTVLRGDEPVTDYDVVHEKQLHLIAVREDLEGYQHVHPEPASDGTWTADLDLRPGDWRLYADVQPSGAEAMTLTGSVVVAGSPGSVVFRPQELRAARVDGYRVILDGDLAAGGTSTLTPRVTRGGVDVTDELEPYLGARGHLVALRHADLAYLHVHPDGLDFHTEVPSAGRYELYLDFKHDGVVRTARFTLAAAEPATLHEDPHHDH